MGELSLDGSFNHKRVLPIANQAREEGYKGFIVPIQNAVKRIVNNIDVNG
jgi:magnesium chelatase family protein